MRDPRPAVSRCDGRDGRRCGGVAGSVSRNEEAHAGAGRGEKRWDSMRRATIRKHSAPTKVPALAGRASSVTPLIVLLR